MTENEIQAVLSRSVIEETDTSVRLHKGQDYPSGILPKQGGEQYRAIRIGASSLVKGSVVGNDVIIEAAEDINLSKSVKAPGTEIQGSVNSLGSVDIGTGTWIRGGIVALGDVTIGPYMTEINTPGHVLIDGGVSGANVVIGDGVVILGPVLAKEKITIGNNVTIRDHIAAPEVEMGDGCLIGGLQAQNKLQCGKFNTIAASQILIPLDNKQINLESDIRSPYPGCNSCPYDPIFDGNSEIARKLSCHLFATREGNKVTAGNCTDWTPFPLEKPENQYNLENFSCVSLIPNDAVNIRLYAEKSTIWERGGES